MKTQKIRDGGKTFTALVISIAMIMAFAFAGSMSITAEAKSLPSKVRSLKAVSVKTSAVKLKWKKAERANKYIIYRAAGLKSKKFKKRAMVKKLIFKDKKVKSGMTYRYYVRAYNGKYGKKSNIVKVRVRRKAVKRWYIGGNGVDYADKHLTKAVKATLYSDGLFKITGRGNVAIYSNVGGPPWGRDLNSGKKIKRVEFSKGVRPTDISSWFFSCEKLKSVGRIPHSVKKMDSTFYRCSALTAAPAIPKGVKSMNGTFEHCSSLKKAPALPSSLESLVSTFAECGNMTKCANIPVGMRFTIDPFDVYKGCKKLRGTIKIGSPIPKKFNVFGFFENAATAPGAGLKIVYDGNNPDIARTAAAIWGTKSPKSKIKLAPY